METPKCPACGSENEIPNGYINSQISGEETQFTLLGQRRETWKDPVAVKSAMEARVCVDCGHISFYVTNLAAIRAAAAKIGN